MSESKKLSPDEEKEIRLASYWDLKFKEAMVAKSSYTKRWTTYLDAYFGDYFKNENIPEYKSDFVANYIFSIVETIRPIMVDNDPKFQAMARQPEGMSFSLDLQEALSYEWDRESMSEKLYRELITTLVIGTSVFFIPWDSDEKNVKAIPVNPFNIFPDPLATSVKDAEYIIYASYKNENVLKRKFPKKADKLIGSDVKYSELVHDNNRNARLDNQILVLEVYTKDYEREETEDDGLGVKISRLKYPNGRRLILCPELGVVLSDSEIPYKVERGESPFPFELLKDYDIPGKFWGEGEVSQLLSPQKHMNELNNAIIDNAKSTANMPWIVDKNAGIPYGKITNRPGLVIRKNPGTEVKRDQPPAMPAYVVNAVDTFKNDMEQISGIFDTVKGNSETGVYTAQGILALQEAGQARIRLKVKLMEAALARIGKTWYNRMKQYWTEDRWIRVSRIDGTYDLKRFITDNLKKYDYDIRITAGSTMPVNRGAMLDLMIRLAQTQMPDGMPLVDREAVAQYLPEEIKSSLLDRMKGENQTILQLNQAVETLSQQLQQIVQETRQMDEQTLAVVEDLIGAIEDIKKQILQVEESNARMEEERRKVEELNRIREESYNSGYQDAENLLSSQTGNVSEPVPDDMGLPDDILDGLEDLNDEELSVLLQSNPELLKLFE